MVIAHKSKRVTMSGTMLGGAEEWSSGFWLGEESADADAPTQAEADAVLAAWKTFFEHANSRIADDYITTQVKVAMINTDGTTDSGSVKYAYPATTLDGAYAAAIFPPQCSLVITFQSDRPRGLASKGRMYLPGYSAPITSTGKISTTDRDNVAINFKAFFDTLRGHIDVPNPPILVAKGTGALPALTAQNDYIQTIKVGDVIDTQRRRRNGLVESYVTQTLT